MPKDLAAVSEDFPNCTVYFPALDGKAKYEGTHTNATGSRGNMGDYLRLLGFSVAQW